MNISLRLNEDDARLLKAYAAMHGISISELLRRAALERIEDDLDLRDYQREMERYKKNPVSYTLEEVERELFE